MRQFVLISFIALICVACSDMEGVTSVTDEIVILGNKIEAAATYDCSEGDNSKNNAPVSARVLNGSEGVLADSAKISFYAQRGIEANGQLLTLTDGCWKGQGTFIWNQHETSTAICAYYPPLPENDACWYDENGQLSDVLIAQQVFFYGNPILLHFEHLFTRISFKLEEELNHQLKEIRLTPTLVLSALSPFDGQVTTTDNTLKKAVTYNRNDTGIYSILFPPGNEQTVDVSIQTTDGRILRKSLNRLDGKRNQSYVCRIKENTSGIGIETAEDFIAFTNLINGTNYKNRSLKEFGITTNGSTTYRLNKDIVFTDEEKTHIRQIGLKGFSDTFDGQGHTLTNVSIQEERRSSPGIFTSIEPEGIVKNLTIKNYTGKFMRENGSPGILCGQNKGIITNCCIQESLITLNSKAMGGIAGINYGTITNCKVENLTISIADKKIAHGDRIGGITSTNGNNGFILNCLTTNLHVTPKGQTKKTLACIVALSSGTVSNCLSDKCESEFNPFCIYCNMPCDHCYYPEALHYSPKEEYEMSFSEQKQYGIATFTTDAGNRQETVQKLNSWIDTKATTLYPHLTFKRWKLSKDNTFTF